MDFQPYIAGLKPADPGPLSRFLPPLEEGVISAWLSHLNLPFDAAQGRPGSWLLDPFGFSPRLVLEAARSGYRVLVTANNPVTRFLVEMFANPPAQSEFTAALADLGAVKKGMNDSKAIFNLCISPNAKNVISKFTRRLFYGAKAKIYLMRAFTNVNIATTLVNVL